MCNRKASVMLDAALRTRPARMLREHLCDCLALGNQRPGGMAALPGSYFTPSSSTSKINIALGSYTFSGITRSARVYIALLSNSKVWLV